MFLTFYQLLLLLYFLAILALLDKMEAALNNEKLVSLEELISMLQGSNMGMALSNFVKINYSVFKEFKKFHIPLNKQAEITSKAINKAVSVSSLSVALSRLKPLPTNVQNKQLIIVEKQKAARFVNKDSKLIFGTQKIKVRTIKNGVSYDEEKLIDWRGLAPNESITSWVLEYKDRLMAINLTGWRWSQIAEAINEHLSLAKKISTNTLTSVISLSNKKITKETNN